ncbi:ABC transporter permease [Bradyrhizobium jicamae]|uniref:ABC transporter permease n=1 Tax=Bradyrhizobium jicamae TaxID=280332 RepID=A0ABS5FEW5_9BRAD|nr:ABC transporter permease [Bradyrhizobium jicamae]MBR0795334.1 ABC transporter permease [Bradyrhizobium jicamae]
MKIPKFAEVARGARFDVRPLQVMVPVISIVIALGIGVLIIASTGASVLGAIDAFWDGMAGSDFNIGASLNRAISLALVGLGFIFAGRANLTNVGGEGQIAMGGMFATAAALHGAGDLPLGLAFVVPLIVGTAAGALWGGLAGFLKAARGTNEVISTLLLSFIALPLVYWSVESFHLLRKPISDLSSLPESPEIPDTTKLPLLFPDNGSPLHIGLLIAAVAVVAVWLVLKHSPLGVRLRAVGLNATASRRAGMRTSLHVVLAMTVSGGFGGLAGAIMILGQQFYLTSDFSSGYGFDGLVVGLLSRGSAAGVVIGALLFGFLRSGSINMEISANVPSAVVLICQGLIVIIIAGSTILTNRKASR